MAISAVVVFHVFFERAIHSPVEYAVKKTFAPLWIGLNIFFVLSGFLITGILIDTKNSPRYFRSFYVRRTLRIFPLYFAALACIFLVLRTHVPFYDRIGYWTYTYNWWAAWGYGVAGLVHLWSLSVEEQFYLIWPVLLFLTPVRRMPVLFFVLIAASFLFRVTVFVLDGSFRYDYFLTPARVEDLCFGAMAAWIVRDTEALARLRSVMTQLTLIFAAAVVIAFVAGQGFEANKWPALIFGTSGVCGLTALWIIQSTLETRRRWWGCGALRWLGTYSYGIYIFHEPFIIFVRNRTVEASFAMYTTAMACAVALACLAAWISYHAFERRFLKWKRLFQP